MLGRNKDRDDPTPPDQPSFSMPPLRQYAVSYVAQITPDHADPPYTTTEAKVEIISAHTFDIEDGCISFANIHTAKNGQPYPLVFRSFKSWENVEELPMVESRIIH